MMLSVAEYLFLTKFLVVNTIGRAAGTVGGINLETVHDD